MSNHDFITIDQSTKMIPGNPRAIYGVRAGCLICGEVREVFADGEVRLIKPGNETCNTQTK